MAAMQMIPASSDTLFIRGFSSRHHVEDIRNFFNREGGRNAIEFLKETGDGEQIFLALKFDSKAIAKEVLNRFDNAEVLGDRISVTWYKDIRKAHIPYERTNYLRQPPMARPWVTDTRFDYRTGVPYRGRPAAGMYYSPQRGSWYSHVPGPGGDYPPSRPRRRMVPARSSSHSRSRSRSRSSSVGPSKSAESHDRVRKRRRSTSDGNKPRRQTTRAHRVKARAAAEDSHSSPSPEPPANTSHGDGSVSPARPKKTKKKKSSAQESGAQSTERSQKTKDGAHSDVEGSSEDEVAGPRTPPPVSHSEPSSSKAGRAGLRSSVAAIGSGSKAAEPPTEDSASQVSASRAGSVENFSTDDTSKKLPQNDESSKVVNNDKHLPESEMSDSTDMASEKAPTPVMKRLPQKSKEDPLDENLFQERQNKPSARSKMPHDGGVHGLTAIKKRKQVSGGVVESDLYDGKPTGTHDMDIFDDLYRQESEASRQAANPMNVRDGPPSAFMTSSAARKRPKNARATGAVGLPPEKMALVREKKEDIEKAYRQDCETFATVTKMLISKDPGIEDRIQHGLRENLKDIGKRCIQELSDFIDRLKSEKDSL